MLSDTQAMGMGADQNSTGVAKNGYFYQLSEYASKILKAVANIKVHRPVKGRFGNSQIPNFYLTPIPTYEKTNGMNPPYIIIKVCLGPQQQYIKKLDHNSIEVLIYGQTLLIEVEFSHIVTYLNTNDHIHLCIHTIQRY